MRRALASILATVTLVVLGACSDDASTGGNSQSQVPPAGCPACKTPGLICYRPAEPTCSGSWYCWGDGTWHCAPPDSGGPGGFPEAGTGDDGGGADGPTEAQPSDGAPADAPATDAPGG